MPHLIGERVMLREYRDSDLPEIRGWVNNAEATQHLTGLFDPPHTEQMTRDFLDSVLIRKNPEMFHFIIADCKNQMYLGQIDLRVKDRVAGRADFGIVIPDPKRRGKGYGSEAIRLLLEFSFNRINLHRIELEVYADNSNAIAVYRNLGFAEEGRHRDYYFRDGSYHDALVMAVLRNEYQQRNVAEGASF